MTTTKRFKLKKGTRQGDHISVCVFVLNLEIVFRMSKTGQKGPCYNF